MNIAATNLAGKLVSNHDISWGCPPPTKQLPGMVGFRRGRGGRNDWVRIPAGGGAGERCQDSALGALRTGPPIESGADDGADLDVEYADGADDGTGGEGGNIAVGHMDVTHGN